MSIRITSQAVNCCYTPNPADAASATIMFWHKQSREGGETIASVSAASKTILLLVNNSTGAVSIYDLSGASAPAVNNAFTHDSGEWCHYAIVYDRASTNKLLLYCTQDVANASPGTNDETDQVQVYTTNISLGSSTNLSKINLGRHDFAAGAIGEYRYFRYFDAVLTPAEIETERKSATIVKTGGTRGAWALNDNTDTDDEVGGVGALTFANVSTDADEPTNVGAGASAVPILAASYYGMLGS